jgi:Ca2+-binding EF-hand superfamily protein
MKRTTALLLATALITIGQAAGSAKAFADTTVVEQTTTTQQVPASPSSSTTVEQVPGSEPGSTATKETTVNVKPRTATVTTTEKTVTGSDGSVLTTKTVTSSPPPNGVVTTHTETHQLPPQTGARVINFMDFDLNHDGVLSVREAGDMLFKLYDLDGNEVIDNKEFEKKTVLTVVPMQKDTEVRYDFDNTGVPDKVEHTTERYLERTQLSRFAHNSDGLSPHEFTGRSFKQMDVNHDGVIDLKEWRGAYDAALDKQNHLAAQLNK